MHINVVEKQAHMMLKSDLPDAPPISMPSMLDVVEGASSWTRGTADTP